LNKRKCIGILGGGQLARMSAYQAYKLGFNIAILEKEKDSPAGQLTKNEFVGWVDDEKILKKFAQFSDVITLENEFVNFKKLEFIENLGRVVVPSSKTISLIQDKLIQKKTLDKNLIPVSKFTAVDSGDDYKKISEKLGKKFLLKSRKMGYDGYGNHKVENNSSFEDGKKKLSARHSRLLAEEFVDFEKELAVMVVRTKKEIKIYPVVETIQKNHICHTVIAPASVSEKIIKKVKEISVEAVKAVGGYGIFGVELFLKKNGEIFVNEMAPRPHNSGHYTIEACVTSQFENHIRATLNLPLGSTEMIKPNAVMINLLGKKNGEGIIDNYGEALKNKNLHVHLYGKLKSRIGRKMGHITMLGDDHKNILNTLNKIEKIISI
jgi:5-(carboxyamino)imidazole ribonucleotide synthase